MAGHFFDSSGIVKRYVNETGTSWVTGLLRPGARHAIHLARITGVEVISALVRRRRGGSISQADLVTAIARFRRDFARRFDLVAITPRLITAAMMLAEVHALRGYDAVQLAAALRMDARRTAKGRSPLIFISADAALNAAALAEGLTVEDPNRHP